MKSTSTVTSHPRHSTSGTMVVQVCSFKARATLVMLVATARNKICRMKEFLEHCKHCRVSRNFRSFCPHLNTGNTDPLPLGSPFSFISETGLRCVLPWSPNTYRSLKNLLFPSNRTGVLHKMPWCWGTLTMIQTEYVVTPHHCVESIRM